MKITLVFCLKIDPFYSRFCYKGKRLWIFYSIDVWENVTDWSYSMAGNRHHRYQTKIWRINCFKLSITRWLETNSILKIKSLTRNIKTMLRHRTDEFVYSLFRVNFPNGCIPIRTHFSWLVRNPKENEKQASN